MNIIINNIFSQFNPTTILSVPLTVLGAIIAITWFTLITKTHWLNTRSDLLPLFSQLTFKSLLNDQTGKPAKWTPILFTVFILCLSYNLLSLIPYTFSQTSHLSVTFSLSLPIWVAFQVAGAGHDWKAKLSHLLPQGTPIFLIPPMILIETISLIIQPLTLGFRLGANLLAGHLLIFLCSCTIWEAINASLAGLMSFILIIVLLILEIAVACIQAAVFLILSKNYLEENLT
uniref:ATP synthase subunit a n=1 Tax=Ophiocomina nigra TaxID=55617 RepID=D3H5U2_9ECHI|nr:ATPase subunit 6 [Ophiocomina nigra]